MSYAKYREDDEKIREHRRYMREGSGISQHKVQSVRYYDCKYCRAIFTEREMLYQHIKSKHNIVRPLLLINGKVANDHCIIYQLDFAHIDLFGYAGDILIDGSPVAREDGEEIDITQKLDKALSEKRISRISFDSASIDIEKVEYSVHENRQIEDLIERWEQDIASGKRLADLQIESFNEGNALFLKGMYNYYVACRATKDKAKRYDDAWAYLSRCGDLPGIGRCVLKIIAYRRNWIAWLRILTEDEKDVFSAAVDFYDQKSSDAIEIRGEKQLYIEDATMQSIELMLLFQRGRYDDVRKKLLSMPDIDDVDDPNLADRLILVSARLAVLDGKIEKAAALYEMLNTPVFREEYEALKRR